ncbi:hypothetical protein KP509_10G062200 [Ceratopteris richardii]|uniref:Uncharacterized protein n=1 Tax=Ceratopteris richardii TaxID=49495 RepID=A0A8T2U221_CERRI|nr:hypothetical protein KP509_10G062200 [Ceratopteris richardii]
MVQAFLPSTFKCSFLLMIHVLSVFRTSTEMELAGRGPVSEQQVRGNICSLFSDLELFI